MSQLLFAQRLNSIYLKIIHRTPGTKVLLMFALCYRHNLVLVAITLLL